MILRTVYDELSSLCRIQIWGESKSGNPERDLTGMMELVGGNTKEKIPQFRQFGEMGIMKSGPNIRGKLEDRR